jgi:Cell division protein 48 (CDC48), N-terminal domain
VQSLRQTCLPRKYDIACLCTQGKKRKDTICIVLAEENCEEHKIRMNKVVRSNLRVRLSDVVSIHQVRDLSSVVLRITRTATRGLCPGCTASRQPLARSASATADRRHTKGLVCDGLS